MLTNKQLSFLKEEDERINLIYGSVRSGKTYITLLKWSLWIGRQPIQNEFLMVGKTLTSLKRNCLELILKLIGENNFQYSISQKKATIFGRTVWLEGANDERAENKIRGMTLKGCYIDELTLIPQDFYKMVLSRLSEKDAKLIATTNPDNLNNYVNTEIILNDKINKKIYKFLLEDNTFLDVKYIENLKNEYIGSPVHYNRFINGNFCNAEGIIFPMIANDKSRYLKNNKFGGIITLGIDWGGNKSAHTITATRISHDYKRIQVLKHSKMVATGTDTVKIFKWIIDFIKEIQLTYGHITAIFPDSAEQVLKNSLITELRNNNIYIDVLDSDKIPIEDRIHLLTIYFNLDLITFNEVGTDVLISALSSALFDDKSKTDRWIDDGETSDIDSLDSFCYSWTYFSDKLTLK